MHPQKRRNMNKLILKLFGLTAQDIQTKASALQNLQLTVQERNYDATLKVHNATQEQQSALCAMFAPYIYATEDISIYEQVARLCALRNRKLSVTEQGSGGIITANLSQTSPAPSFLQTCVTICNPLQFVDMFHIDPRELTQQGMVQRNILQQMVSHIETTQKVDLHLLTLAQYTPSPFTAFTSTDIGTIYLGVMDKENVQIHKYQAPNTSIKADIMHFTAKLACFALYQILK